MLNKVKQPRVYKNASFPLWESIPLTHPLYKINFQNVVTS